MARGDQMYDDVDALDDQPAPSGDGLTSALVIVTTILLLGAIIVGQMAMKKHFGENWFSKDSSASSTE